MRHPLHVLALIGIVTISPFVQADEASVQWLSGVEFSSEATYAFVGRVTPLPGNALGNGWVTRLWADWSHYRYEKGGQVYRVDAPGVEAAIGYQQAQADHWWSAMTGLTYRHSSIAPDDLSSAVRGSKVRVKFQAEGEQSVQRQWKVGAAASYVAGQRAYWMRGRVIRLLGEQGVGVEAIVHGDPDYRAYQFGVLWNGIKTGRGGEIGIKIGGRHVEGLSTRPYIGIEFGSML